MTLVRPFSKILFDSRSGALTLEWDKFFNDVQVAINNLQQVAAFTLSAAATTTVTDTRVTASSHISCIPTNAAAATLQGGVRSLYVSARTPGVSFTVRTANGVAAGGTETFVYSIIG